MLIQWLCRSASVQRPYVTEVTCRGELIAIFVEAPRADYYDDDEERDCIYVFQLGTQAPIHVLPDPELYCGSSRWSQREDWRQHNWAPNCRHLSIYWTLCRDSLQLTCLSKNSLSQRDVGPIWTILQPTVACGNLQEHITPRVSACCPWSCCSAPTFGEQAGCDRRNYQVRLLSAPVSGIQDSEL